jgi:hypothetical protein
MTEPETFTMPLPFPPPHGPHPHDVIFFRSDGESGPDGREHEDIMLRRVPREIAMRYRAAAGARGMTHAQYLTALVELHARLREAADGEDELARTMLDELGLQTVSV